MVKKLLANMDMVLLLVINVAITILLNRKLDLIDRSMAVLNMRMDYVREVQAEIQKEPPTPEEYMCDTFPEEDCEDLKAIVQAESKAVHTAYGKNTNGSLDVGYMQINEDTFYDLKRRYPDQLKDTEYLDLVDPYKNIDIARMIYDERGLYAWSTYKSGKYLGYKLWE